MFKNILLTQAFPIRVSIGLMLEQMPQWIYIKITFQPSGHNLEINLLKYYIKIKLLDESTWLWISQIKTKKGEWPGKVFNHYYELQLSALTRCSWFSWRDVTKSCSASKLITPPVQPRQCSISWHLNILPCNDSRVKSTGMLIWWASKPL